MRGNTACKHIERQDSPLIASSRFFFKRTHVCDSRYPFYAGAGSMAVVLAGGSWVLGVHWGWGLTGVWVAYAADEWLRGLLMWRRWLTLAWVPHARTTHARMRAQTPTAH